MIPNRGTLFSAAADDLHAVADGLVRVAAECREIALGIESEQPELLRLQGISLQTESMRTAMTALTLRAVSERLALVSKLDTDQEAMDDG